MRWALEAKDLPRGPGAAAAPAEERTGGEAAPITCRACGHAITEARARRQVAGRHLHLRLNPSAYAFIFGCFAHADGCAVLGAPTDEATWFAGCRWQYAHCARCGAHLGWRFSGAESFFGLILERLSE